MSFWNDLQRRVKRSTSHRHLHNEDDAAVTLDSGNATAGADLSSSEKTSTAALWDANSSGTSRIDGQKVKYNSPRFFRTEYTSLPVSVPANFLAPLSEDAVKRREDVRVERVDFEKVGMMEYKGFYAVVVDGLFDEAECEALIKYAEMSAGGHRNGHGIDVGESQGQGRIGGASFVELGRKKDGSQADDGDGLKVQENGWHTALLRHGQNRERLAIQQRNSQRIIWMNQDIASRIWKRIEGVEDVRSELQSLEGERWNSVIGTEGVRRGERWRFSKEGLSEGLKFLKYGVGGYFREHCDGTYETPSGDQKSLFTIHLYLNSAGVETADTANTSYKYHTSTEVDLEGGATTFWSRDLKKRFDVECKTGRVLIFQQKGLLHSGEDVRSGVKFTMRGDVMYEFDDRSSDEAAEDGESGVVFG